MQRYPHQLRACEPYWFSNDEWNDESAPVLFDLLSQQTTPEDKAAALVIGAGGMPYLLGRITISQLVLVDRERVVTDAVAKRIGILNGTSSWDDYMQAISTEPMDPDQETSFKLERRRAYRYLAGDHTLTTDRARRLRVSAYVGDVIQQASQIGHDLRTEGLELVFVNFTNVGNYLEGATDQGRRIGGRTFLSHALQELPLAHKAVVVDSSMQSLFPQASLATDYIRANGQYPAMHTPTGYPCIPPHSFYS